MSHTQAVPVSPLKQWWLKWRFHLNILLILIPLGFMPKYFSDAKLFRGEAGLGANVITGIQADWYQVFLGAVLLLAVIFNNFVRKKAASR